MKLIRSWFKINFNLFPPKINLTKAKEYNMKKNTSKINEL